MLRLIVGLSLVFLRAGALRAEQPSGTRELDEAKQLYREAKLAECIVRVDAAIQKLRALPLNEVGAAWRRRH